MPLRSQLRSRSRRLGVLALLCSAEFAVVVDFSITTVALGPIGSDLGFAPVDLPWVVNAYGVAVASLLLLGGRAADVYGRRALFVAGTLVFTLSSLAGGFAPNPTVLVIARALQGVGGALVSPAALSLLMLSHPEPRDRARALGTWGAVSASGIVAGLLLGGALVEYASWRWVLWVNVPLGLVAAVAAPFLLTEVRGPRRTLDLPGATLATLGLLGVVFALTRSEQTGATDPRTAAPFAVGALLLGVFAVVETRVAAPLLPPRFLRRGSVGSANLVSLAANAALAAAFVTLSLYLSTVLDLDALAVGAAFLPIALAILLASVASAPVLGVLGPRLTVALSLTGTTAGLVALALALPAAGQPWVLAVVPATVLVGTGYGLAYPVWTAVGVQDVASDDQSLAAAVLTTSQEVGAALGLALLTAVAASGPNALAGSAAALGTAAVMAAAGAVVGAVMPRGDSGRTSRRADLTGRTNSV